MNKLWNVINEIKISRASKCNLYLGALMLISFVIGAVLWLVLGRMLLPGIEWLFCFMGYAVVAGFLGGVLYIYNHEFA